MRRAVPTLSLTQILVCGAAIVTLSTGIRHGFGLWMLPITQANGWTRETFSLALAIQNLAWGVLGIVGGMLADRHGAFRVLVGGTLLYALGLAGMALAGRANRGDGAITQRHRMQRLLCLGGSGDGVIQLEENARRAGLAQCGRRVGRGARPYRSEYRLDHLFDFLRVDIHVMPHRIQG